MLDPEEQRLYDVVTALTAALAEIEFHPDDAGYTRVGKLVALRHRNDRVTALFHFDVGGDDVARVEDPSVALVDTALRRHHEHARCSALAVYLRDAPEADLLVVVMRVPFSDQ